MKRWMRHLPLPLSLLSVILAGVAVYFKWPNWLSMTAFIAAAVLLLVGLLVEIEGLGDLVRRRGARFGFSLILAGLFVLVIITAVNWLGARHFHRWDLTRSRMFSLSEQTVQILKKLDRPVRVIGFFTRDNSVNEEKFDDLIKEFRAYTDKLTVEKYDPVRYPTLASQYQVTSGSTVVFIVKEKSDKGEKERFEKVQTIDEENLSSGLIRLLFPQKAVVCYLKGHGQIPLSQFGSSRSLSSFKRVVEREQYTFEEVDHLTSEKAKSCTVVMIVAPQYDLMKGEDKVLDAYLKDGGRIWLLADQGLPQSWKDWLSRNGVTVNDDIVFDELQAMFGGDPSVLQANTVSGSPISPQGVIPGIFAMARTVEASGDIEQGRTQETLMRTLKTSWADRNGDYQFDGGQTDVRGPLTVGVAVKYSVKKEEKKEEKAQAKQGQSKKEQAKKSEKKSAGSGPQFKKEGRLVVIGDADWLTDGLIGLQGGVNAAIGLNTLAWLAQRELLISKEKPNVEPSRLSLTPQQLLVFRTMTVFFIPAALLFTAGLIWWRRRSL